jgi:hypothetical protein
MTVDENKDSETTSLTPSESKPTQSFQENQKQWLIQSEELFDKKQFSGWFLFLNFNFLDKLHLKNKTKHAACLECINNLQASVQNQLSPSASSSTVSSFSSDVQHIHQINETKISMNKTLCELALSSYKNSNQFKQKLKQISSQVET